MNSVGGFRTPWTLATTSGADPCGGRKLQVAVFRFDFLPAASYISIDSVKWGDQHSAWRRRKEKVRAAGSNGKGGAASYGNSDPTCHWNMSVDAKTFRDVMSRYATGVTIVTTQTDNVIHGLTVNAFCSVSLSPPLVLICIDRSGKSITHLSDAKTFAVNLLATTQRAMASRFADSGLSGEQRFEGVTFDFAANGAPIFHDSLGYLECCVVQQHEAGDHTIFVGEVISASSGLDAPPLVFYRSKYCEISNNPARDNRVTGARGHQ